MPQIKVVLDTNALLRSISRRSLFSIILDKLYEGEFELWVSNDILLEYEEKISDIFGLTQMTTNFLTALSRETCITWSQMTNTSIR
jgi:predicted nucleic acid-binding protein